MVDDVDLDDAVLVARVEFLAQLPVVMSAGDGEALQACFILQRRVKGEIDLAPRRDVSHWLPRFVEAATLEIAEVADVVRRLIAAPASQLRLPLLRQQRVLLK